MGLAVLVGPYVIICATLYMPLIQKKKIIRRQLMFGVRIWSFGGLWEVVAGHHRVPFWRAFRALQEASSRGDSFQVRPGPL